MLHQRKAEPARRAPATTALDAGATIQDALVRRLRLTRPARPGARPLLDEDRAPIVAVVGRRR